MLSNRANQTNLNQNISNYQKHSGFNFSDPDRLAKVVDRSFCSVDFELIIESLDILFLKMYDRSISTVEILLLEGVWQNQTYSETATQNNYSSNYLTNVAAPKLFKKLSKLIKCRITKKNCRSIVTKYILEDISVNFTGYSAEKARIKSLDMISENYYKYKQNNVSRSFLKDTILLNQIILKINKN